MLAVEAKDTDFFVGGVWLWLLFIMMGTNDVLCEENEKKKNFFFSEQFFANLRKARNWE